MDIQELEAKASEFAKAPEKDLDSWIRFMGSLHEKCADVRKQINALLMDEFQIQNMQLEMCQCCPSEYDGENLLLACCFVPVFVENSDHWTYRHIDRENEKEKYRDAYLYAKDVWRQMTKGVDAHNFKIGRMANNSEVYFVFTVANVPGEFLLHLPIGKEYGEHQRQDLGLFAPMQVRLSYAMATCEDVWSSVGMAYRMEDIAGLLNTFVATDGYKGYLPKDTEEKKFVVDGHEMTMIEKISIPQSVWDEIEKSKIEAGIEKGPVID